MENAPEGRGRIAGREFANSAGIHETPRKKEKKEYGKFIISTANLVQFITEKVILAHSREDIRSHHWPCWLGPD